MGLGLKEMVSFFKKQQLLKCNLLKHSANPVVQKLYEARAKREQQQRQSKDPVVEENVEAMRGTRITLKRSCTL